LIRDGEIDTHVMKKTHTTTKDLEEDLRSQGLVDWSGVKEARLERSGKVSVVKAESPPKVVEVDVADGVQRVRIEIG
jgi:uncharacterized membrane protein YcaP (DUF421 family)